ncbi:putative membrane protein [Synechococcus sp. NOUM97013]|nr:putative membrane protein [Synechococcus sp. NOUM97013]
MDIVVSLMDKAFIYLLVVVSALAEVVCGCSSSPNLIL